MDFEKAQDVLFRDVQDLMEELGLADQQASSLKDNVVAACTYAHTLRSVENCLEYTHCPKLATTAMRFVDYARSYEPSDSDHFTMIYSGNASEVAADIVDTELNQGPLHFVTDPTQLEFFGRKLGECVDALSEQVAEIPENDSLQSVVHALGTVRDYYHAVRHQIADNLRVQMAYDVPAPA